MVKKPKLINVLVALNFDPPGTLTTRDQFLAGLQQAFNAWAKVCNVTFVLVQNPKILSPVKCRIVNNPNFFASVDPYGRGYGTFNISNAPNKAIRWDQVPTMTYDLMAHELGHILGLGDWERGDHPKSIMNWGVRPNEPGAEDIIRVQKIWGKPIIGA